MSFQYDQLPNNDLFRIFELKPGKDDDPLQGNLRTFLRKEAPAYEALSYILDCALRRLRLASESRYLWIDQICINQECPNERSEQVGIMTEIYSGSVLVTAWLGQADPREADDARRIISALASMKPPTPGDYEYFLDNESLQRLGLPHRESPAWVALNSMLETPYFSRVWIIQELAVAPTYDLLWGDVIIPEADFEAFKVYLVNFWMVYPDPDCVQRPQLNVGGPSKGVFPQIHWPVPMGFTNYTYEGRDLLDLVSITQHCHATDPADKISALIGLAGEKTYGIMPDYTKTKLEFFTEFALKAISETRNLKILNYSDVEDPTVEEGLPLWAPRWHHETTRHYLDMSDFGFKSSKDTKISAHTLSDTKVLQLKGLHIERIKETHSHPTMPYHQNVIPMSRLIMDQEGLSKGQYGADIIRPIVLTLLNGRVPSRLVPGVLEPPEDGLYLQSFAGLAFRSFISTFAHDDDGYDSDRRTLIQLIKIAVDFSLIETPWKPIFKDPETWEPIFKDPQTWEFIEDRLNQLYPYDMEIVSSYLEVLRRASYDIGKEFAQFKRNIAEFWHRSFFITEKGYVGTGPPSLKPGDSVCILFGGDTPYIIRPRSSTSDEHLFLGNAYVHGIMHGEAITTWEMQRDSQDPRFEERLFKLI